MSVSQKTIAEQKIHDLDEAMRLDGNKRILIIDDDVNTSDVLKMYLENQGYEVDSSTDGVQGVKKIMAADYAVILCDMVMPNLSGEMFYVAVERIKPHLCKRFVFMTGHQQDAKIDAFIRRIHGLMVWKPFQLQTIMEAIHTIEGR
jgi:DNA-binding NtrC family response regulator